MLGIRRTPAFRNFQAAVGAATFHINTAVVGLELVARGGAKPSDLNIKWTPPKQPRDSVEQTKQFILVAILTLVIDSFDALLRDYADLEWLGLSEQLAQVLRRSLTKPGGKEYSIADRAKELLNHLGLHEEEALSFLTLAVAWRNSLVHTARAEPRLAEDAETCIRTRAESFSERYAGIDVVRMLKSFANHHRPTLKEATTMVAASQNLARALDEAMIRSVASRPDWIVDLVRKELGKAFKLDPKRWKTVWSRDFEARMRAVRNFLPTLGITETDTPISADLDPTELDQVVRLTISQITTAV